MTQTIGQAEEQDTASVVGIKLEDPIAVVENTELPVGPDTKNALKRASPEEEGIPVPPRKRRSNLPFPARSININHLHFDGAVTNKNLKCRTIVPVQLNAYDRRKVRVQLTNTHLPFGVQSNDNGKLSLSLDINEEEEYRQLQQLNADILKAGQNNTTAWWSKISHDQVVDNFNALVSEKEDKKDSDGQWPGKLKVELPISENGDLKDCEIKDHEGNDVSVYDLKRKDVAKVIIELPFLYFINKYTWGVKKKICKIQLAEPVDTGRETLDEIDYV